MSVYWIVRLRGRCQRSSFEPSRQSSIQLLNNQAPSPVFFARPRVGLSSGPSRLPFEGSGAPRNAGACEAPLSGWRGRPTRLRGVPSPRARRRVASRRSTGGVLISAPGRALLTDRQIRQPAVSQLLAGVRSDPGRSPGAARVRVTNPPAGAASTFKRSNALKARTHGCRISGTRRPPLRLQDRL